MHKLSGLTNNEITKTRVIIYITLVGTYTLINYIKYCLNT